VRTPTYDDEALQGLAPSGPPLDTPGDFPVVDNQGELVAWYKEDLKVPSGEVIPALRQIDERLLVSTKVRTCRGCDSPCAPQCRLTDLKKEEFRGHPCPIELQRAWDVMLGFCRELQIAIKAEGNGEPLPIEDILDQVSQIDLVNEYIFWDLLAFRAHMQLAQEDIVEIIPSYSKGGDTMMQPQLNFNIEAAAKATDFKLRLSKEFMTTRRGRLEAALKTVERATELSTYLMRLKHQADQSGKMIEAELMEE